MTVALRPLTLTSLFTRPLGVSLAVPLTGMLDVVTVAPSVGDATVRDGFVRSILNAALLIADAILPASSVHVPELTVTDEPSLEPVETDFVLPVPLKAVWHAELSPEPPSVALNVLLTETVYQLLVPFGDAGVAPSSVIDGASVSILTVSCAVDWLVALSVAWQSITCVPLPETEIVQLPAPAGVRVSGVAPSRQLGELAFSPEPASEAVTVTVTGLEVFQPLLPLAVCVTFRLGAIESCSVWVVLASPSGLAGVVSTLSAASVASV